MATVLWAGLGASLVVAFIGLRLIDRGHRQGGLGLLLASTMVLLAFSGAAGFSIGRFTAAIPVVLIGLMVGRGRGALVLANALLMAVIVYIICSWLLTPLVLRGGVFSWLFGAWAIPLYTVVALTAYVVAAARQSRPGASSSSR